MSFSNVASAVPPLYPQRAAALSDFPWLSADTKPIRSARRLSADVSWIRRAPLTMSLSRHALNRSLEAARGDSGDRVPPTKRKASPGWRDTPAQPMTRVELWLSETFGPLISFEQLLAEAPSLGAYASRGRGRDVTQRRILRWRGDPRDSSPSDSGGFNRFRGRPDYPLFISASLPNSGPPLR